MSSCCVCVQLWAASGHLHQRLTCDRDLYYPELAVSGPILKQVPADSGCDVQQGKRAKLAGGQYRRSFREAASACDSTPPGTPYRPGRQQQQQQQPPLEERAYSIAFATTSSSSSYDTGHVRRQSACSALADREGDSIIWPIVVHTKKHRSSRRRRTQWQHWPPALQGLAAGDAASAAFAVPGLPQPLLECGLQQLQQVLPRQGPQAEWQQQQADLQQEVQAGTAGGLHAPPATPLHQAAVQEIAAAFPSTASVISGRVAAAADLKAKVAAVAAAAKSKVAAVGGDVSPGHEASQLSDATVCGDSPRAVAGAVLSSWPSSSTESDCQAQHHECDGTHKAATVAAVAAAAGKRPLGGPSVSPESPSSPLHEVF